MNKILSAVVAAYIATHLELTKLNHSEESLKQFVAAQLQNALTCFRTYPQTDVFYSTANEQVFYTASEAWSHAQALHDNTVLKIERKDIAQLLEDKPAETPAVPKYAGAPIELLREMCTERTISFDPAVDEATLITLLEVNDKEAVKKASPDASAGHLLLSSSADQVIASINACEDIAVLEATLALESGAEGKRRKTVIAALTARLKVLAV